MLAVFRFVLGLGMGGEWNTGATLVAETWPTELRAKAIALVQSSWAIGYALAALVAGMVLNPALWPSRELWEQYNWRAVFLVGVLPALIVLWIRKDVPESEMWRQHRAANTQPSSLASATPFTEIFSAPYRKSTIALLLLNFFGMFAWWGLFTWMPAYLSLPVGEGGRGFGLMSTTTLMVLMYLIGMFPGYASFGWVADYLGRRKSFILYTAVAALLVPLYAMARDPYSMLLVGTVLAFFGTGFFSGSGIIGSEIFPTRVRARALGFTYNGARTLSSIAPYTMGRIGQNYGLSWAFVLCGVSFLLAAIVATQLPETKGKRLD